MHDAPETTSSGSPNLEPKCIVLLVEKLTLQGIHRTITLNGHMPYRRIRKSLCTVSSPEPEEANMYIDMVRSVWMTPVLILVKPIRRYCEPPRPYHDVLVDPPYELP